MQNHNDELLTVPQIFTVPQLLTVPQVAEILKCSTGFVYTLINTGQLRSVYMNSTVDENGKKIKGKAHRIHSDDLLDYMQSLRGVTS